MKAFLALALLAGCATSYQPHSFSGGYSEFRLSNRSYRVSFAGNGYTSPGRARQFAIRRAAELAAEEGSPAFCVLDGQTDVDTAYTHTPVTCNSYGGQTQCYGGQTNAINRPTAEITVRFVDTESDCPSGGLETEVILAQFRQ
jgi:hypothetical protein